VQPNKSIIIDLLINLISNKLFQTGYCQRPLSSYISMMSHRLYLRRQRSNLIDTRSLEIPPGIMICMYIGAIYHTPFLVLITRMTRSLLAYPDIGAIYHAPFDVWYHTLISFIVRDTHAPFISEIPDAPFYITRDTPRSFFCLMRFDVLMTLFCMGQAFYI